MSLFYQPTQHHIQDDDIQLQPYLKFHTKWSNHVLCTCECQYQHCINIQMMMNQPYQ